MKKALLFALAFIGSAVFNNLLAADITIGTEGYAVTTTTENLDFSTATGIKAYIVKGVYSSGVANLQQVSKVPTGTVIIVKGVQGTYTVNAATGTLDDVSANKLKSLSAATTLKVSEEKGLLTSSSQIKANRCALGNCWNMKDFTLTTTLDEAYKNLIDSNRNTTFSTCFNDATTNAVTDGGDGYGHIQLDLLEAKNNFKIKFIGRTGDWPDNPTSFTIYGANDAEAWNSVDLSKNTSLWTELKTYSKLQYTLETGSNRMADYFTSDALGTTTAYRYVRVVVTKSQLFENGKRTADMMYPEGIEGYEYAEFQIITETKNNYFTYSTSKKGFDGVTADTEAAAGTAYIQLTDAEVANVKSNFISVDVSDGISTINNKESKQTDNTIYDLQGRRVQNPSHGIYIQNGKKIINK
jgi:hypothetical protein